MPEDVTLHKNKYPNYFRDVPDLIIRAFPLFYSKYYLSLGRS